MKRFYCRSPVLIFIYSIAVFFFAFGIVGILVAAFGLMDGDKGEVWERCVICVMSIVWIYVSLVMILYTAIKKLEIKEDSISINKDVKFGCLTNRLQYAVDVKFSEINSLSYMESKKDSLGHDVAWIFVQMPYLVFHCDGNKKKAINLYYFSRRQRIQIIDEVIARVQKEGRELNVKSAQELIQSYKAK